MRGFTTDRKLYEILVDSEVIDYDHKKLVGYLSEKKLDDLVKKTNADKLSGVQFISRLPSLKEDYAGDYEKLWKLTSRRTFNVDTALGPNSNNFQVGKLLQILLSDEIRMQSPNFILVSAPRGSGKALHCSCFLCRFAQRLLFFFS